MSKPTAKFSRGQVVRSTLRGKPYSYRVTACGPKRATLVTTEGSYFRCYCSPALLQLA